MRGMLRCLACDPSHIGRAVLAHGEAARRVPEERLVNTYPMAPVDAAWYHLDGPANLAIVTGVALTKKPLDFDRVRETYRVRLAGFDRFHQRVVETGFPLPTPHWQDMPHFDIDQHVHRIALPAPHDMVALKALFTDIASMPLDREQPLWQVHVVDNVAGGSALVMRYHHCIGDGSAINAVVAKLFDSTPDAPLGGAGAARPRASRKAADGEGFEPVIRAAGCAVAFVRNAVDAARQPQRLLRQAGIAIGGVGALLFDLAKPADPPSPFKGDFRMRKHVAWSMPVAIADIKAIGAPSGAKVNDVLVAAMAGALRAYLKRRGVDVDRARMRAMVPVDLRPPERIGALGNEFGLVLLELPVASSKPADRLAETKARMDRLKRSPEPLAMKALLDLLGRTPKAIEDFASRIFGSKASVVLTNVAGPREPAYLAGVPIDRMMFWVPHPGRQLGVGISILSYCGMAALAVIADAGLVPDPESITDEFNREFDRMRRTVTKRPSRVGRDAAATMPADMPPPSRKNGAAPARRAPAH